MRFLLSVLMEFYLVPAQSISAAVAPAELSTESCSLVPRLDDILLTSPLNDSRAFSSLSSAPHPALKSSPSEWWDLIRASCAPFQPIINSSVSEYHLHFFTSLCPQQQHRPQGLWSWLLTLHANLQVGFSCVTHLKQTSSVRGENPASLPAAPCRLHPMCSWMRKPLRRREPLDTKEKLSTGRNGKKEYIFIFTRILGFRHCLAYSIFHSQFPYWQFLLRSHLQGLGENCCWSQLLLQLVQAHLIHILISSACFLGNPVILVCTALYDLRWVQGCRGRYSLTSQ